VLEKIKHSGFAYDLQAGIVVTGGASQIDFLCEYLAKKSGMKVKKGVYNPMLLNNLSLRSGDNQSYSRCLALLLAANDNDSGTAADAKRTADLQPKPLEEPAAEVKMPVPNPQTVPVPPQPETEDGEEDDDEEEFELKPPKASVRNIIGKGFKKLGTMINNEVKNITDTEDEL
jgi:cell division protein FtsA